MNDGNTKEPMLVEDGAGKPSNAEDVEANSPKGGRQKGQLSPRAERARACCFGMRDWFRNSENLLVFLTVAAVVLGMTFGFIIKASSSPSKRTISLISFPGELFMNMLKMLIIPLIVSSLVSGLAALDAKSSGRMGSFAVLYYFMTTIMAVILGIILVVIIHPGSKSIKENLGPGTNNKKMPPTLDAFLDLLRNIFPPNLIQATIQQYQSYIQEVPIKPKNGTNITLGDDDGVNATAAKMFETVIKPKFVDHTNVLGLVTFSIAFGMIMGQMGEKALLMVQFFSILNEVVMRLVQVIMWASPAGIFFLVVGKILAIENLKKTAQALALYMLTVVLGLIIHACITLALLFFLITRRNPLTYFKGLFQAWITALGTASSAATLPITFRCLEENNKVDARVTRFVLPIGATINMDGTALYEAVASIFIAQINGFSLHAGTIITISVTATLAAIGAASVPSAGLVTMILVLSSVGLPTTDITLIFAVDWLLDRLRTSVNVLGDAFGAGIVEHLCREQLNQQDADTQRQVMDMIEEGRRPSSSKKRMSLAVAMRLTDDQPVGLSAHPEDEDDGRRREEDSSM